MKEPSHFSSDEAMLKATVHPLSLVPHEYCTSADICGNCAALGKIFICIQVVHGRLNVQTLKNEISNV